MKKLLVLILAFSTLLPSFSALAQQDEFSVALDKYLHPKAMDRPASVLAQDLIARFLKQGQYFKQADRFYRVVAYNLSTAPNHDAATTERYKALNTALINALTKRNTEISVLINKGNSRLRGWMAISAISLFLGWTVEHLTGSTGLRNDFYYGAIATSMIGFFAARRVAGEEKAAWWHELKQSFWRFPSKVVAAICESCWKYQTHNPQQRGTDEEWSAAAKNFDHLSDDTVRERIQALKAKLIAIQNQQACADDLNI